MDMDIYCVKSKSKEIVVEKETHDQAWVFRGPCFMVCHGKLREPQLTLYDVFQHMHHTKVSREFANKLTFGSHGEWILARDFKDPSDCCILNAKTLEKFQLPVLGEKDLLISSTFLLSGSLVDDATKCTVFVINPTTIFYCKIGADQFSKLVLGNFTQCLEHAVTIFQGKIYFIENYTYNLHYAQLQDSSPLQFEKCINGYKLKDQLLFDYECCSYLFGSCDRLYFVKGRSLEMGVMEFEIFRADLSGKIWEQVSDIGGDCAIFLDHEYRGVSALVPVGGLIRGNCIYYSSQIDARDSGNNMDLFCYNIEYGFVKALPPLPFKIHNKIPYGPERCWINCS